MNQSEINKKFKQKTPFMRVIAGFLDAVSVVVLGLFVVTIAGLPIANEMGLRDAATFIRLIRYTSALYVQDENTALHPISDQEKLPEALYTFYVDVPLTGERIEGTRGYSPLLDKSKANLPDPYNTPEDYYVFVLLKNDPNTIFDFSVPINPSTPWMVSPKAGQAENLSSFYQAQYQVALTELKANPTFAKAANQADTLTFGAFGFSYVFSALVMIVIFPLFTKDGVTLGKKMTGATIANNQGYKLTKPQALLRGFSAFLLYYLLFFLPISFVSLIIMLFHKQQKSFVDFIAITVVLDKKNSVVYRDASEEKYYNIILAKQVVKSQLRDHDYEKEKLNAKKL